jgi:hypothetical protein
MPAGCKWLAVIHGATHMNLAGRGMSQQTAILTTQVIGAFLDGVQRGECKAPAPQNGIDIQAKCCPSCRVLTKANPNLNLTGAADQKK